MGAIAKLGCQPGPKAFGIFDLLKVLQENRVIEPTNAASVDCHACSEMHFRQWYRGPDGARFYVCAVAGRAMFQGTSGGWRPVLVVDLVRWLLSKPAAVRAA